MTRYRYVFAASVLFVAACGDSLTCGAGTIAEGGQCVVDPNADGSTGLFDGGVPDSSAPVDPCAAHAGQDGVVRPVVSYCNDKGQEVRCDDSFPPASPPAGDTCVYIDDADSGQWEGFAVGPNNVPCDSRYTAPVCAGAVRTWCVVGTGKLMGYLMKSDCTKELGWADATCGTAPAGSGDMSGLTCAAPENVSCNPSTFVPSCSGDGITMCQTPSNTAVLQPCGAHETCYKSRVDQSPVCLPTGAVSTGTTPSSAYTIIGCSSSITVHAQQDGYDFEYGCPMGQHISVGDGGVAYTPYQEVCDPTNGCVAPP